MVEEEGLRYDRVIQEVAESVVEGMECRAVNQGEGS